LSSRSIHRSIHRVIRGVSKSSERGYEQFRVYPLDFDTAGNGPRFLKRLLLNRHWSYCIFSHPTIAHLCPSTTTPSPAAYARNRSVHPGILAVLMETGQLSETSDVLEVGCGTGDYIFTLHETTDISSLNLIPDEAFQRGIEQMERMERASVDRPVAALSLYILVWGSLSP